MGKRLTTADIAYRSMISIGRSAGAEFQLNTDSDECSIEVTAPRGKVWSCDGVHVLVGAYFKSFGVEDRIRAYNDLSERMKSGTERDAG